MSDFELDGLDAVPLRAAEAGAALEALKAPAEQAARTIDEAFAKAGTRLAGSLARAAADGKVSLAELARAVLEAASAGIGGVIGGGLAGAVSGATGPLFGGARAEGGPVAPGGAYLVGERGPEVFRPTASGTIGSTGGLAGGGGLNVTVNVQGGDIQALARSDAQLAQALVRAASLARR
ncbi:MAG: phage tail tape measure protein [Caulobacter sp.]|nr:phage tail tape measure protein [Caulobacter sp.]